MLNTYHATGECRRQVKNITNLVKNVKIVEFHYHIWNHHEKCIQISTNMPGLGLEIREISRILRNKNELVWMVACKVLSYLGKGETRQ